MRLTGIVLATTLALVGAAASVGAIAQVFEIDEMPHASVPGSARLYTYPSPAGGGSMGIAPKTCIDFAHVVTPGFLYVRSKSGWTVQMFGVGADTSATYNFKIGSVTAPGQVAGNLKFLDFASIQKAAKTTTGPGSMSVGATDRLNYRFCTPDGAGVTLFTDTSSNIVSPDGSDDMYPTPEIASVVLSVVGLGGLGAIAMVRRRQL